MIEPKEAHNAPKHRSVVKSTSYKSNGSTHLTFAGSNERTRLKRPYPATVVQTLTVRINDRNVPNAVPETIRSSSGPSSAGDEMLIGVDAPLGVAERDRPKRLKKPMDLEEIADTALIGVNGL
jgi:hypothetical protein